jgi:hypothetical protein
LFATPAHRQPPPFSIATFLFEFVFCRWNLLSTIFCRKKINHQRACKQCHEQNVQLTFAVPMFVLTTLFSTATLSSNGGSLAGSAFTAAFFVDCLIISARCFGYQ